MKALLTKVRRRFRDNQRLQALGIALAVTLMLGVPMWFVAPKLELMSLDWRFRLREILGREPKWSDDLIVVAIDEESAKGLPVKVPTPREYLARLIERLAVYRPRVIGLDILLDRKTDPKADRQLVASLRKAGNVVLACQWHKEEPSALLPEFRRTAKAIGFADIPVDEDAVTRRFILHSIRGGRVKSLPAVLYELASGKPVKGLGVTEPVLINYQSPSGEHTPYPAYLFFARYPPPRQLFTDKIVLIGVTHPDTRDSYFVTPYYFSLKQGGRHYSKGVEIIAHALNTLLTRQFLREPSQWVVKLMALALALLTFAGLTRFSPTWGAGAAFAESVAVLLAVLAAFLWGNWVLPTVPLLIAVGIGYIGALFHHFLWTRQALQDAQERMVQMEKMRALVELASGVVHDVRNALSPVLMTSELLLEEATDPEWQEALRTIHRSGQDAVAIVNRLRLFSKQASEQEILLPVNLNELVTDTVTMTHPKWYHEPRRRGVEVKMRTALVSDLPPVLGNPTELREVLVNLIFNAVEAMPDGGTITIRTWREGNQACLAVQDTGLGMDEEVKRRAFEPFFTTKGEQGTGMGLSICYGIITRHQGSIEVQSEPGKGTAFLIRLPATSEAVREAEIASLPPLRVLLIDDDEIFSAALAEVLRRAGHKVDVAHNGQMGLQQFQPGGYEVVLVDWLMPGMNGLEVTKVIKQMLPDQTVILMTAWQQELGDSSHLPVDIVVAKPLTQQTLWAALQQAIQTRKVTPHRRWEP